MSGELVNISLSVSNSSELDQFEVFVRAIKETTGETDVSNLAIDPFPFWSS